MRNTDFRVVGSDGSTTKDSAFSPRNHTWRHCLDIDFPAPHVSVTRQRRDTRANLLGAISWTGSLLDGMRDATGQVYMRNRYYDPSSGRFTQEDPIGLAGGLNVYGFAKGDPVSYDDPYGLCKRDKKGNEDPDCRRVINALRSAAGAAKVSRGQRNLFNDAADQYEATARDVVFADARERRLNQQGQNSDGDPGTFAMGRTMPNGLFGGKGDILIANSLGEGDMVMTAAHEMLAHDKQRLLEDLSPRVATLNNALWDQLPDALRPSAQLWRQKLVR